jgi:formylglycine-generating enzyme
MRRLAGGILFCLPVITGLSPKPTATPDAVDSAVCAPDMIEVEGDYCPAVEQYCRRHVDPGNPKRDRCAEFSPTGRCFGKTTHMRFCIDRYEWPNKKGAIPTIVVTWDEAKKECEKIGKRLCQSLEWTLACEGQERLPYPYGYTRNPEACNIDKPYILPDNDAFANPATRAAEIARIDQREPSGSREGCVSPFGVHDMTGNVDEWVINETGKPDKEPYVSGLKGGYWGPVRNRCRPMTVDHNQWHNGYQIGFRCCADVKPAR